MSALPLGRLLGAFQQGVEVIRRVGFESHPFFGVGMFDR